MGTAAGDTPDVWVWVDSAASCNLSCALCYTIPMQSKAYMSLDTFRRVVANVAAARVRVQMFHLNWRGEPALNPKLPEMLSLLA
ncbi:MAG TPA: hypothetical protein VHN37_06390, partial [Actinomycetota bacterium]|nr:hypothetical protein [Actinomycetota bacterium]